MHIMQSRRHFLATASLAAAAGVLGARASLADEGPPETTTVRLPQVLRAFCVMRRSTSPRSLLRAEGFTDVRYVRSRSGIDSSTDGRARRAGFRLRSIAAIRSLDLDAGVADHGAGGRAFRLLRAVRARADPTISDLKGKKVGIQTSARGRARARCPHGGAMSGSIPTSDIDWVTQPDGDAMQLFAEGKIDAFLGFPPEPQELRARRSATWSSTPPWTSRGRSTSAACWPATGISCAIIRSPPSACCGPSSRPIDICAAEPEGAAQHWSMAGSPRSYDYALQTLSELPYDSGASSTPRTRCASMRFACMRSA